VARHRSPKSERGPGSNSDPRTAAPKAEDEERRRLLHDLDVHRVELEMQNEELKRSRAALEVALADYTELFDFAPIGYATLDIDGKIVEVNHAAARVLGRERAALAGASFHNLIVVEDRFAFSGLVARSIDSRERVDAQVQLWPRKGRRVFVELSARLLDQPGAQKVLLAVEDVTSRKERDAKLEETERALRDADRKKDDFLAALSHELRNPLAPIRTALYVLMHNDANGELSRRAQEIIDRQVGHLARMVDDLLDVTRIARGKVVLRKERLELGALLRKTIDDHRLVFEAADLILESRFEPGRFWIDADPARIVQTLTNVLGNAVKFTPAGGFVVVRLEGDQSAARVVVSDSGLGVAPDLLPHVFEPFSQGPQTMDRSRGGLGLGLPVVRGLVEAHGGSVSMSSAGSGGGTTLAITLPLAPEGHATLANPDTRIRAENPRRVLVIEDNVDAASTLRDALTLDGHEVEVAHDGASGLARARSFRPEIVVCDIGLPGMDGYDVARALHAEGRGAPYCIALSGYAQPEDVDRSIAAGFRAHLSKPTSLESLERLLQDAPPLQEREHVAPLPH
jgi:PAS domain S-box-containing protein